MNNKDESVKIDIELMSEDIPFSINSELLEVLTPNEYLASMGITREKREEKIKQLANAVIKPNEIPDDFQTQIPFMIIKGPFIKEEFLTVNINKKEISGKSLFILSLAKEPN